MTRPSDIAIDALLFAPERFPVDAAKRWTPEDLRRAVDTLLRIPFFAALSVEQLLQLTPSITTHHTPRGETLLQQGGREAALYVLLRGRAHVVRTAEDGREVILDVFGPGSHAGEMCLIDNLPHSATVRASEPCLWLRVDGSALARCMAQDPRLAFSLMHALVQRLRRAHRQITSLALLEVPERVMHCLEEFADTLPDGTRVVRERLKRQDLARLTGASREMVSRVLHRLEAQGHIQTLADGSIQLLPPRAH